MKNKRFIVAIQSAVPHCKGQDRKAAYVSSSAARDLNHFGVQCCEGQRTPTMGSQHRTAIFLLSCFLFVFLAVRAADPTHSMTHFYNMPSNLFFFDDSQVRTFSYSRIAISHAQAHRRPSIMTTWKEISTSHKIRASPGIVQPIFQKGRRQWSFTILSTIAM